MSRQKNTKKWVCLTTAICMSLSMILTGCGGTQNSATSAPSSTPSSAEGTPSPATDYPSRAITYIIPFAAGGGTDVQGRVFAQQFNKYLPEEVVVSNITGSSGTIAANEVRNSPADGYKLLHGYAGWPIPYLMNNADFTYQDFDQIGMFSQSQYAVLVKADARWETIEDLVAEAKSKPGEIKIGMGTGQQGHAAALLLQMGTDVEFKFIDIGGTVPKPPELLAGRVDLYCDPLPSARQYLESGDFRCLGIFSNEEVEGIEFPALGKIFGSNMSLPTHNAIWLKKDTPQEIKDILEEATRKTCEDPEYIAECKKLDIQPVFMDSDKYYKFLEEEFKLYEQIFS